MGRVAVKLPAVAQFDWPALKASAEGKLASCWTHSLAQVNAMRYTGNNIELLGHHVWVTKKQRVAEVEDWRDYLEGSEGPEGSEGLEGMEDKHSDAYEQDSDEDEPPAPPRQLKEVAKISVSHYDRLALVEPYDDADLLDVEEALQTSSLQLLASIVHAAGQPMIRVAFRFLNAFEKAALVKEAKGYLESFKKSVRDVEEETVQVLRAAVKEQRIASDVSWMHRLDLEAIVLGYEDRMEAVVKAKTEDIGNM